MLDIDDRCDGCGYSRVYCDGYQHISGERCCSGCTHAIKGDDHDG